jgi:hypothetical protein
VGLFLTRGPRFRVEAASRQLARLRPAGLSSDRQDQSVCAAA